MADQQEQHVGRRLLQRLQQGIGRPALQIVGAVDHHDATGRQRWGGLEQPLEPAHLIDADIACGDAILLDRRQLGIIGMRRRFDQAADRMAVRHRQPVALDRRACRLRQQPQRQGARDAGFPDAFRPREDPGMVHPAASRRLQQRARLRVVADQHGHGSRSDSVATSRSVTSSAAPDASTARTRSGSSAAKRAKASATAR